MVVPVPHVNKATGKLGLVRPAGRAGIIIHIHIKLDGHIRRELNPTDHQHLLLFSLLHVAPVSDLLRPGHFNTDGGVQGGWELGGKLSKGNLRFCLVGWKARGGLVGGVNPRNISALVVIPKQGRVQGIPDRNTNKALLLVVEQKRAVQPISVFYVLSPKVVLPQVPHAVHVGMVCEEDGISTRRVEDSHVLPSVWWQA
ncbi:unnamed protein product [Prunus armeniaca]